MPRPPLILPFGTRLGGFEIQDVVGIGGMAVVYRAVQVSLGRPVALKVLNPRLAADSTFRERFRREAALVAGLDHSHVVPVYDFGEIEGRLYIAMRLVSGETLADRVHGPGLTARESVEVLRAVGGALEAAHDSGLLHRDVKPQNILLSHTGHAYLADFGVAKASGSIELTAAGGFLGSVSYVSPEQIRGDAVTAATDIYSLAVIAYECFAGRGPFRHDTEAAVIQAHLGDEPPPLEPTADPTAWALTGVLRRGLAKDPSERHGVPTELVAELEAVISAAVPEVLARRPAFPAPLRPGERAEQTGGTAPAWAAAAVGERAVLDEPVVGPGAPLGLEAGQAQTSSLQGVSPHTQDDAVRLRGRGRDSQEVPQKRGLRRGGAAVAEAMTAPEAPEPASRKQPRPVPAGAGVRGETIVDPRREAVPEIVTPRSTRDRLRTWWPALFVATALLVPAAAGIATLVDQEPATTSSGAASVAFPDGWIAGEAPAGLFAGMNVAQPRAVRAPKGGAWLGVGTIDGGTASLVPQADAAGLRDGKAPAPTSGSGLLRTQTGLLRRYVAAGQALQSTIAIGQQPQRITVVSCRYGVRDSAAKTACAATLASLDVSGPALTADPSAPIARVLGAALATARIARLARALPRASASAAQRRSVAAKVAAAYGRAAKSVGELATAAPRDGDLAAVRSALERTGTGFGAVARAAGRKDRAADHVALQRITAGDDALRAALRFIAERGYTVGSGA